MSTQAQALEMKKQVVVVGAGPGGVVMAYLLARSGVDVVLVERHTKLDREFRGYFFQPLVLKLLDEMGLLTDLLKRDHHKTDSFHFIDRKKELFSVNFFELSPPYNYGLLMHQPLFLAYMIEQASRYKTFTYLSGTRVTELHKENGRTAGIKALQGHEELIIRSQLVVGADGRFSTIRKLAEIVMEQEAHDLDFVWFDLPGQPEGHAGNLQIQIERDGMLIYTPKGSDLTQIGWVIPKGTYTEIKARGLDSFKRQLMAVDPHLAPLLHHLVDFKQISVLDVQVAMAAEWIQDGLMLIGDAAHIASPFSGQGNSLAIQDAVVAHGVIMHALERAGAEVLSQQTLKPFEQLRRGPVEKIKQIQRLQAKMVTIKNPLLVALRRTILPMIRRTPIFGKMRNAIAMGTTPIHIGSQYFKQ
ncbi:MAG TPA: FAD-dependent monooxygenase [Paenibacillus sp.]|nr:FAD-dependent monooxygenase [Paenibacillus sp.]